MLDYPLKLLNVLACGLALAMLVVTGNADSFTTVDPPGSVFTYSASINTVGAITGYYCDTTCHGFVRDSKGVVTTVHPPGWVSPYLASINSMGAITGYYYDGAI